MENRLGVAKRKEGGREGMDYEFRISRCELLYKGWINKALLYGVGNAKA